ncbi:MAG: hypothetical protein KY467_05835, partial [Gemmatimonadetes bacterium]|nr:hypothetical protein [Gemmatimonadota bacterium]
ISFDFVLFRALLCLAGLEAEGTVSMSRRLKRRRHSRGGAVGVVVDRRGRVLGTYLDPFTHPRRVARIHGPDSPWSPPVTWGETAFAWEGFGETEEEALGAANRLRRRHLQLFGLLEPGEEDENRPEGGILIPPVA